MKTSRFMAGSAAIIVAMLAISAWTFSKVETPMLPVHWGPDGRPNGFAPSWAALLTLPGLAVLISVWLALLPRIAPKSEKLQNSALAYGARWIGVLLVLLVAHLVIAARALGIGIDVAQCTVGALMILVIALGNYMGKIRYNYVFGFRTPWTLVNERVWDQTHRFLGRGLVLGGFLALVLDVAAPLSRTNTSALAGVLAASVLGPVLASLVYSVAISRERLETP